VALELASLLLRFSNEQRAADWGGERGRLVQNGRYSKEAAMLSKVPPLDEVEGKDPQMSRKKCLVSSKIGKKQIKSYLAINQRQQNMSKVLGVQIVNNMLIYVDASGGTFFVGLACLMSSPQIQKSSKTCHRLLFVGFLSSDCFLFWQPNLVIFRPRRLPHNIPTCSIHFETTCSLETYF